MTPALKILSAGPGCTIQDAGRHGYLRYGVTAAGPMDPFAHRLANLALGNADGLAALEISAGGVELTAEGAPLATALAGGDFTVLLEDQAIPLPAILRLEPGLRLAVRAGASGAWCYLAVAGGLEVPLLLGSTATHTRSQMGGLQGRALIKGDLVPAVAAAPEALETGHFDLARERSENAPIRVLLGPQDDYFAPEAIAQFLATPWRVSARCDRMAYYFDGPALAHAKGYNITSDGIAMGAIQVPGTGQPIVLMADRQSTGGYPKIGTVIGPDLGRLAQARPGSFVRFEAVSHAQALEARRAELALLSGALTLSPVLRETFPSAYILRTPLVDGYVHD
nr:biotin-dependent carboxyltransferase family protein [uncultured Acidocella sp.]